MNTDFRLDVGFFDHHKTRRLIASLGLEAAWSLIRLWAFAAVNKPDGRLSGMTDEDIAAACHYEGDAIGFVAELRRLRWLRNGRRSTCLNDWSDHQPFAINAPRRQAAARKAAKDRWNRLKSEDASRMPDACEPYAPSNAPPEPPEPPEHTEQTEKKKPPPTPRRASRSGLFEGFTRFWAAYPPRNGTKRGRAAALAVWEKAALEPNAEELIAAITNQKRHRDECRNAGVFCAEFQDAERWLKNGRWQDEIGDVPETEDQQREREIEEWARSES